MNALLMHARNMEAIRTPSNDERRASWASRYFALGLHRRPEKPRYRVTVPEPLTNSEPDDAGKDNSHD